MNALWKKELRLVMPASLAVVALAWAFAFMYLAGQDGSIILALLLAGGAAVGALGYGQELEHQTLDMQLTVPVSRKRIWWTKLAALALGVLPLCLHLWLFYHERAPFESGALARFEPYLLWTALSCLSAALFTWKLGSTLGGAAVGGLSAVIWFGLVEPILWTKVVARSPEGFAGSSLAESMRGLLSIALAGIVALIHYRSWMRGEIRGRRSTEEGIHNWSLIGAGPDRRRPLLNLIVKEVRLQTPAIFVALVCVAFSLLTYASRNLIPPEVRGLEIYKSGVAVIIAIVPLLAGCTALAEERTLRSLQPLVALPRAWATMFLLKAVTSCALALLLGAALPMALEGISGGSDLNPTILFTAVFSSWAIGLFAGSVSTGTLKAVWFACAFSILFAFLVIPWPAGTPFAFVHLGVQDLVRETWLMFPRAFRDLDGQPRVQTVMIALGWILSCLTTFLLLANAWKFGRQSVVTNRQIVAAVVVILALTAPLAIFVLESIVVVDRLMPRLQ